MKDTIHTPSRSERRKPRRAWSPDLVAVLPTEQQGWMEVVEAHDRQRFHLGAQIVETGLALQAIRDNQTYKALGCETLAEFCDSYRSIGARQSSKYTALAGVFTVEQLRGKRHNLATLTLILEAPESYRAALVEQGSGHKCGKITAAVQMAKLCESIPLGLAVIAHLLADGPRPAEMNELEERVRAERQWAQAQSALSAVIRREGRLGALHADPDLPAERRRTLVALCGGVVATMARLGYTAEAAAPAQAEAEPKVRTARVSPDGSVSTTGDDGATPVRPEHGAPDPHMPKPSRPPPPSAEADGGVRPAGERRSQDRADKEETREQHNQRLCAEYEPEPLIINSVFDLDVPSEWPEDWEQRWLETPAGPDPILLCADAPSPQRGTLGRTILGAHRVSLNLNGSFCGLIISNPGGGKTYAGNVITHMAVAPLPNVNQLPNPLCAVMPHYHSDDSHEPEVLSMRFPNRSQREVSYLVEEVGSLPAGHEDIVVVCFAERVELMRQRHPHVQVYPLLFASGELTTPEIEAMLGIDEPNDDRLYVRQLRQALRGAPPASLDDLEQRLLSIKDLMPEARRLVQARIALFRPMICDGFPLRRLPRSGRVIIVDGRDPTRSRDEALTMLHVAVSVLMRRAEGQAFHMLLRVDELHEFAKHKGFMGSVLMRSRKRRHLGDSLLCSTQFGQLVPEELVANSDLVLLGRTQSGEVVRHIARTKVQFSGVTAEDAARLKDGEMLVWAEKVYVDPAAAGEVGKLQEIVEIQVRAQNAQHGGATRCSVAVPEGDDTEE